MRLNDDALVAGYASNILAVFQCADRPTRQAGASWYSREHYRMGEIASETALETKQISGAASAISPGCKWALVPGLVRALAHKRPVSIPTYSHEFVRRAKACLKPGADPAAILSGPKTTSFYRLLAVGGNNTDVCVDGHAWNIARGARTVFRSRENYSVPSAARVSPRRYDLAAQAYRLAGTKAGLRPCDLQAITWLHWRANDDAPSLFAANIEDTWV